MAAGNDDLYRRACEGIGRPELAADPRFASTALRARNQVELRDILEAEFARHTAEECLAIMRRQGVPCAPINRYSEALADPQVAYYGWVQPLELANGARTRTFASPLGRTAPIHRRPPALGEHTVEALREIGFARPADEEKR
jgi:crotonobetainyl-CoA:carnitine CoA-transferase CaiB-like acyl-CoA transferase